jgi:hypothetical protein
MKEKFDIGKLNSRLATLCIILASIGITVIILENVLWSFIHYFGFYEFVSVFTLVAMFLLPSLFVGWVFSWVIGRRRKDVEHIQLPIIKGVATIVLFFGFFLALNFQSGQTTTTVVLDMDDLTMDARNGDYYLEFYGNGKTSGDEYISLEVTKDQFDGISNFEDTCVLVYTYFTIQPAEYHFELAKSDETEII